MKLKESLSLTFELEASSIIKHNFEEVKAPVIEMVASVNNLKDIFNGIDLEQSDAISYYVGELFNAGVSNKNGQVCSIEDTIKIYKKFEKTYIDLDHNRKNIVGFIVKANLTDPETKQILTEEEAINLNKSVNVSIGFIVWPHCDPEFYKILEACSKTSNNAYGLISLSWEMSVSEYNVLKGSNNVFDGSIITDDNEIEKLTPYLKVFGGSGKLEDGTQVHLLATGDLTPLGAGLVINPAAKVEGVINLLASETSLNTNSEDIVEKLNYYEVKYSESINLIKNLQDKVNILEAKGSQPQNTIVRKNRMKIKNIADINNDVLKEIEASEVVSFISDELAKKSAEYTDTIKAKEDEIVNIKAELDNSKTQLTELSSSLNETKKELEDLKAAAAAEKVNNDFQFRMNSLNEEFVLADEETEIIASQIRGLDDEGYSSWKKAFDVLAKEKSKSYIDEKKKKEDEEAKKKGEKTTVVASTDEPVTRDPLEELKAKAETVANTSNFSEDVLKEFKDAFSLEKGVSIQI